MQRPIALLGAPSSIGSRPYDHGGARHSNRAPARLRAEGLVARLGARDLGDVIPPPYRDFERPKDRVRNQQGVAEYSRALGQRVHAAAAGGAFVVVLGGDCSIVLGCLLGARQGGGAVGLAYLDAHGDFATLEDSPFGSAASMCLALAVGRGDTLLAQLDNGRPLVRPDDVALIGRRDHAAPLYRLESLRAAPLLDLPHEVVRARGPEGTVAAVLERLARPHLDGFWIHLDADLIDPSLLPAVDSPLPDGLLLDELALLLRPLVHHPRALGLELTIYDPALDPDGSSARRLAALLEQVVR